jgi:hypothetical protein
MADSVKLPSSPEQQSVSWYIKICHIFQFNFGGSDCMRLSLQQCNSKYWLFKLLFITDVFILADEVF